MGKYYLISNIPNIPYNKYKGGAIRLSGQTPVKVDEVIIGSINDPNFRRKITTYRDGKGNIIERAFDYSGESLKNRLYSFFIRRADEHSDCVHSSQVKEFILPRKFLHKFLKRLKGKKLDLWTPVKVETHHIKELVMTNEKIHSMTRISEIAKGQIPVHTIIEFPHKSLSGADLTPKKYLQFKVNPRDYSVIQDSFVAQNVLVPGNDSYLGFRILSIEDLKTPITKRYINERGLDNMNIKVGACQYKEKDGRTIAARFAPWNGTVEYNKLFSHKSKSALVNTARHEVEHAWQYYLNARNGCYSDGWEMLMYKKFGDISTSPALRAEADKYSEAISSYVPVEKDRQKYFDSLIEALARKAGEAEKTKYDNEGQEIRKAFPNIPKELL